MCYFVNMAAKTGQLPTIGRCLHCRTSNSVKVSTRTKIQVIIIYKNERAETNILQLYLWWSIQVLTTGVGALLKVQEMKFRSTKCVVMQFVFLAAAVEIRVSAQNTVTCFTRTSKCFLKRLHCPAECPFIKPPKPKSQSVLPRLQKVWGILPRYAHASNTCLLFSVFSVNRIIHIDER